ncbi:MAG: DUF58 domain-containing protein [Verrucomicrobiota bacterium JB023]|nr:DUF58 domain-containing protein [Verrucomicrobiota bacterium JB023]
MNENWLRFLHRIYSRSGRWGWSVTRRIKPMGWGMMVIALMTAILGTDIPRSGVYIYFCGAVSLLLVGFIWFWFRRARLVAVRHLPAYASVDEELRYASEVTNVGRAKARALELEEWSPDPRPSWEEFSRQPEPGEEMRNIVDRHLLYYRWTWLQDRKRGFDSLPGEVIESLAPGESRLVTFHLTPQRRGLLQLADLRALLPDPLGLFQRCLRVPASEDHLIVLPKRYRLGDFVMPGQARLHLGGEAAANTVGQTGDFLNLREYRPGDPFRTVDWKTWARTGSPVVREYEENFFPRYGLILDTSGPGGPKFEEAVSVAASFVASIDTRECLLDLMFVKGTAIRSTAGRGVAKPGKLLQTLATVEAESESHFDSLLSLVGRHQDGLTACLVVFPGWNDERADFFNRLQRIGLEIEALAVAGPDDETSERPGRVHVLRVGHLEEDLQAATSRFSYS